jgi:hypothetical protein
VGLYAGVAAGAIVLVGLAVLLIADPFSAKVQQPAVEPELTLRPGKSATPTTAAQPAQPSQPSQQAKTPQPTASANPVEPQPTANGVGQPPPKADPPKQEPEAGKSASATQPEPPPKQPAKLPKTSTNPTPPPPKQPVAASKGIQQVADALGVLKIPPASTGQGLLIVNASPWGTAIVDGKEIGETPKEMRVGAGRYRVKVLHPTLGAREGQVLVKPGEKMVFLADFSSK